MGKRAASLLSLALLLATLPAAAAGTGAVGSFAGGRWQGWDTEGPAWGLTSRARTGAPPGFHAESLAAGEPATGALRSRPFTISGNVLRFLANGWDGRYGGKGVSGYSLRRARDGALLRSAPPPCSDDFSPIAWPVGELRGQSVYLEAVDGDRDQAFAWLGLADVRQESYPASTLRPLRLQATGTWAILTWNGARQRVPPYLSSLGAGEEGTGTVRSPLFRVASDRIRFTLCGHDGQGGGKGVNFACLRDADTGELLRQTFAPGRDPLTPCEWEVRELIGRRVVFSVQDGLAEQGYAWLGLGRVDAGPGMHVAFTGPGLPPGWRSEAPQGSLYVTTCGVPFLALPQGRTVVPVGGQAALPLGFAARRIFLLGMINTWDHGNPVWGPLGDYSDRLFLGSRIGEVVVEYANGTRDVVPLTLGHTAWWYGEYLGMGATEPFASDPAARAVLERALALYPTGHAGTHAYLCALRPRPLPIRTLRLVDNPALQGAPAVAAVTVDSAAGPSSSFPALGAPAPTSAQRRWLAAHTAVTAAPAKGQPARLDALRRVLYGSATDTARPLPASIPRGFRGPPLQCEGPPWATVLANLYHHSLQDMDDKVDADGTFHTSTRGAPTWGGYQGFGTWKPGYGAYYDHAWSRDLGRVVGELAELGYDADARACAAWCDRWLGWFGQQFPRLAVNGQPVPGHWVRIINHPEWTQTPGLPEGFGNLENDGHGLIMLYQYRTWLHTGRSPGYLAERWPALREAGEYICWLADHPEISRAHDGVLYSDSEGGNLQASIYCDVPCWLGLRAYADMAQAAGHPAEAARWHEYAGRLGEAIGRYYPLQDPRYGDIWDPAKAAVWPFGHGVLAPVIVWSDYFGLDLAAMPPEWQARSRRTLARQLAACRPPCASGVAMGYGQCFITQAALLLDRMGPASRCLQWLAQLTYCPRYAPYIVPEGCEIDPTGTWWHRTGDLGNAVQEGEAVKCVRIVVGIDDTDPERTVLIPRLPAGWRSLRVQDYPVMTQAGKRLVTMTYRRQQGAYRLWLRADGPLADIAVRLGPFPAATRQVAARVNGADCRLPACGQGDAAWAWLRGLRGGQVEIAAAPLPPAR